MSFPKISMTSNKPGPPPTPHRAIRIGKYIWLILNFLPVASLKIGRYSTPHALLVVQEFCVEVTFIKSFKKIYISTEREQHDEIEEPFQMLLDP